jgi:hypothetical protein
VLVLSILAVGLRPAAVAQAALSCIPATAGTINTCAGGGSTTSPGGPATSFNLLAPRSVSVDSTGNLFIADPNGSPSVPFEVAAATGIITYAVDPGKTTALGAPVSLTTTRGDGHTVRTLAVTFRSDAAPE